MGNAAKTTVLKHSWTFLDKKWKFIEWMVKIKEKIIMKKVAYLEQRWYTYVRLVGISTIIGSK